MTVLTLSPRWVRNLTLGSGSGSAGLKLSYDHWETKSRYRKVLQVGVSSLFSALGLRFIMRWLFVVLRLLWSRVFVCGFVGAANHKNQLMMRAGRKSCCLCRSGNLMKPSSLWHDLPFVSSTEAEGDGAGVGDGFWTRFCYLLLTKLNQTLAQIFRRAWKIHQLLFKLLLLLIISTMSKKRVFPAAGSNISTQLRYWYFHTPLYCTGIKKT